MKKTKKSFTTTTTSSSSSLFTHSYSYLPLLPRTLSKHHIYLHLWSWFHLIWILFSKWLGSLSSHSFGFRKAGPSSDPFTHHIVILGDDFALGYGDRFYFNGSTPGVGRTLLSFLHQFHLIKHTWTIFNFGQFQSTSKDWLPPSLSKKKKEWWTSQLSSFLRSPSCHRHSVVLCLGFHDTSPSIPPVTTVQHLQEIALELSSHFGFVYLCTIPDAMYPDSHPHVERNQLLRTWIQR
ncbi:hypothetical protein HMI55_003054 [Coelomomyces lativittatus]|nr:hypothetical protein HMI55_003054 [Coelomomyces lativittatus]